jgi:hypothetical protein
MAHDLEPHHLISISNKEYAWIELEKSFMTNPRKSSALFEKREHPDLQSPKFDDYSSTE